MKAAHRYRDLILRAVRAANPAQLNLIASHLADCERAKSILRAKGYGPAEIKIDALASLVPTRTKF